MSRYADFVAAVRSAGHFPTSAPQAPAQRTSAAHVAPPPSRSLAEQIVRAGRIRRGEVQANTAPTDATAKAIVAAGRARRGEDA